MEMLFDYKQWKEDLVSELDLASVQYSHQAPEREVLVGGRAYDAMSIGG